MTETIGYDWETCPVCNQLVRYDDAFRYHQRSVPWAVATTTCEASGLTFDIATDEAVELAAGS